MNEFALSGHPVSVVSSALTDPSNPKSGGKLCIHYTVEPDQLMRTLIAVLRSRRKMVQQQNFAPLNKILTTCRP